MEQAISAPVTIPFGLPCRDEAGWRWNADNQDIPVDMETTLTSSMEDRTVAFFDPLDQCMRPKAVHLQVHRTLGHPNCFAIEHTG